MINSFNMVSFHTVEILRKWRQHIKLLDIRYRQKQHKILVGRHKL